MRNHQFSISMKLLDNYLFEVDFGSFGKIITDEPTPLGNDDGPNPVRLLAASVGNCLAASLVFALRKFKDDPGGVSATVTGQLARQDKRWRIETLDVDIHLGNNITAFSAVDKAMAQFEDFCVVTQSVRQGIEVNVTVFDRNGHIITQ